MAERHSPTSQNPSHLLEIDECGWSVEKKRDNKGQKAEVIANSKKKKRWKNPTTLRSLELLMSVVNEVRENGSRAQQVLASVILLYASTFEI